MKGGTPHLKPQRTLGEPTHHHHPTTGLRGYSPGIGPRHLRRRHLSRLRRKKEGKIKKKKKKPLVLRKEVPTQGFEPKCPPPPFPDILQEKPSASLEKKNRGNGGEPTRPVPQGNCFQTSQQVQRLEAGPHEDRSVNIRRLGFRFPRGIQNRGIANKNPVL